VRILAVTEEQLFLAVLDLANPADRAAYLDVACGRDVELRRQVENLLAAHFKPGEFLDEPVGKQLEAGSATPSNDNSVTPHANLGGDALADEKKLDEEPHDLRFLQSSTRPGSLGRIGHYEVLQVLGRGGFGIVFRAYDDLLQRVVALKVLAPAISATSPARKRFLREARSSAKVRHENVVQVYAVEEQPLPYLVMEFIPGETLQQRLDRTGPLEASEIVRLGRQIAEGLAAAHATGLIHRDIKPGNVLIEGGHQRVNITDFGLARAADDASLTQSGVLAGTPIYMSPEQAKGESLDHRTDLFSLGSVLYVMATGRPPFRASTTYAVLKRVVEDDPRPIRELIPEMPEWLCEIIAKLQTKKPEDRFQSAREVADVLAACETRLKANDGITDFSPIPRSKPVVGRSGRWKWLAAATLLLPVLALALTEIAGITHWLQNQQPTPDRIKNGDRERVPRTRTELQKKQPTPDRLKFGDPDYTNTLGMKFKLIPAGKFMMGSPKEEIDRCLKLVGDGWEKDRLPTEGPEHEVEITQPFYMGTAEVTIGQFRQFVEEEGYHVGDVRWTNPGSEQTDNRPVVFVSWQNAVDFCNWLSEKEGRKYRLPTEAEWEYSCRAGRSGTRYCFGDDDAQLENYGWYNKNSGKGTKKPNDWGLYHMHGNAWEWCQDFYDPDYYKISPVKDPPGGAGDERVLRGGSWNNLPMDCRSAFRNHAVPRHREDNDGFRVLLVVPPGGVRTQGGA
jgi:eukaryotic-like serine/threonine-protein kinase